MTPAIEHGFLEEPLPEAVVLDADFVISVLHEGEEYHQNCVDFAARLFEEDVPVVHSQLLRLEFMSAWQKVVRRHGVPETILPWQGRLLTDPLEERSALYKLGDEFLSDFLSLFERYEVRLSARLQDRSRSLMATYNLKPMDACLVACAFQTEVVHIASLDADLRKVDGLHLWNDHIPAKRQARRRARR